MDKYILDADRKAVRCDDPAVYGPFFESNKRRVGRTSVGPYDISTVFLVFDHRFGDGPPELFETMVFGGEDGDEEMGRCSTWAEAEAMHERFVELCRARIMRTHTGANGEHGGV